MAEVTYRRGDHDNRPWGRWEVLDTGEGFAVKRITVNPGAILSLQLHHHREEHWVIVRGRARVTRGSEVQELARNQAVFIPLQTEHVKHLERCGGVSSLLQTPQHCQVLFEQWRCPLVVALCLVESGEIAKALARFRMVSAQGFFADCQRLFIER